MIKNYNIEYIHCINISKLLNNNNINSIDEHCVPHTNQKLNNNITDNNEVVSIDENILKEILENTKEYLINFKVRNIISNKIIFDRIKGGYCDICERIHENENSSYIILYDNIYRLYCRRNENKYIEFSLKTNNNSIKLNKYLILKNNIKYNNNIIGYYDFNNEFTKSNSIIYNNKELKEYDFKDKNVLIIHGNVKIGKTKKLKEFINNNNDIKYIIIISFRILFSVELKSKFKDFINYLDIKTKTFSLKKIPKIIIQLDSLYKLLIDIQPDLIILDEVESILNQFSSPHIKNIKLIWEIFEYLLKTSKKILCMDANITPRTINLLTNLYNKDNIIYHHNSFSTISNDEYYIMFNFNVYINILCEYIEKNKKIVIPVNSLKKGKLIYKYLTVKYEKKKLKYIQVKQMIL